MIRRGMPSRRGAGLQRAGTRFYQQRASIRDADTWVADAVATAGRTEPEFREGVMARYRDKFGPRGGSPFECFHQQGSAAQVAWSAGYDFALRLLLQQNRI